MRNHDNRLPDDIQQLRACFLDGGFLDHLVCHRGHGGGVVCVEDGIAHYACSGPLGVQMCLRPDVIPLPGCEVLLHMLCGEDFSRAIVWCPGTAAAECLVEDVAFIALG